MYLKPNLRLLVPCLLLCLTSCGLRAFPVEGAVTCDGVPLVKGSVVFWPDEAAGNKSSHPATAQIRPDGTYALYTNGSEGAPVGVYKVSVISEDLASSIHPEKTKLLVPEKYTKRETTPLTMAVVEDPGPGAYDLKLK